MHTHACADDSPFERKNLSARGLVITLVIKLRKLITHTRAHPPWMRIFLSYTFVSQVKL